MNGFFSTLGEPLGDRECALVGEYLHGLGIEDTLPIEPNRARTTVISGLPTFTLLNFLALLNALARLVGSCISVKNSR